MNHEKVSDHDRLVPPRLQHSLAEDLHAQKLPFPVGHMGLMAVQAT
jgi:hypothetical protein